MFWVLSLNLFGVSFKLKPFLQYSQTSCYEYAFITYIIIQIIIHIVYFLLNWKMNAFLEYSCMLSNFHPRGVLWISSDRDDQMEAKIKTKKKSLDQNLTPKKSHAEFLSHKNFQKALKNITRKIETLAMECLCLCLFIHDTIWSKNLFRIWWP